MSKIRKIVSATTISGLLLLTLFVARPVVSQTYVSGHKIVIDAGHGGTDSGSTACPNYPEKDANLDIAMELKELLKNEATVYMTRTEYDETFSNADRYNYANSVEGAEVLVSIHLNGSNDPTIDGTQGLYGKRNKDKAFTNVMHSAMWDSLKNTPDFIDFGVTNFASGVLLKSNMPATIQETVFISSSYECNLLKTGVADSTMGKQKEIAQALYNGLNDWFGQTPDGGDGGNGGGPPPGKGKPNK